MADVNMLPQFVLLLVVTGMLLGVGIVTFQSFAANAKIGPVTVVNENQAPASLVISLNNWPITQVNEIANQTGAAGQTQYLRSADEYNITDMATGKIKLTTNATAATYIINYTGYRNSTAAASMEYASTAISSIGTTWMGLIVVVAVLSIVLTLVIRSFGGKR